MDNEALGTELVVNTGSIWRTFQPQAQKTKNKLTLKIISYSFLEKNFFLYFWMTADQVVKPKKFLYPKMTAD